MKKNLPFVVGLVGSSGAGKTTVAIYLQKKDFHLITLSSYLKKEARKRNISVINKKKLQDLGNEMRIRYGSSILAEFALSEIQQNKVGKAVIDGIRNVNEIKYLKDNTFFVLIAITADIKNRHIRIVKQKGKSWVGDYKSFLDIEKRDSNLGDERIGLQVENCINLATYNIKNNGSYAKLYSKLDSIINSSIY